MNGFQPIERYDSGRYCPALFRGIQGSYQRRGIQILDRHIRWGFFETLLGKPEKQAKGVTVACEGIRARFLLTHEAIGEKCLQQNRERGFGSHGKGLLFVSSNLRVA